MKSLKPAATYSVEAPAYRDGDDDNDEDRPFAQSDTMAHEMPETHGGHEQVGGYIHTHTHIYIYIHIHIYIYIYIYIYI